MATVMRPCCQRLDGRHVYSRYNLFLLLRLSFTFLLFLLSSSPTTTALQSLKPSSSSSSKNNPFSFDPAKLKLNLENPFSNKKPSFGNPPLEARLLAAISQERRDETFIEGLIEELERTPSIPEPAIAPQLYGRWRLQYTTTKATSSPIQRTATTRSQSLSIFQDIVVENGGNNNMNRLLVKQIIQFSDNAYLTVDALASTKAYPLAELAMQTPRQSTGKVFGLNLLGVSKVGIEAAEDPNRPNARINFVFDEGYFDLNNGTVRIPYPVPFRLPLFRDWVKGWIDVTYLSNTMRIARGNKGSTFVLVKEEQQR